MCSAHLLYWYKSTNTDARVEHCNASAARRVALASGRLVWWTMRASAHAWEREREARGRRWWTMRASSHASCARTAACISKVVSEG